MNWRDWADFNRKWEEVGVASVLRLEGLAPFLQSPFIRIANPALAERPAALEWG